ncbi:MAG TPA: hypothetical protein VI461_07510, partial [Chitinophagaceae bacterium]|nr:hypothetical protein [Chitinophagaceae bacterium]
MKKMLLVSVIAGFIMGCQKEFSYSTTSASYESLNQFYDRNQKLSQTFSANCSNSISLQTGNGTKITFQPNSFVTMNDQPVTGDVSIEVKEILTPSEMILNRALT